MSAYSALLAKLEAAPRTWLVTGAAGFIGSNLVETLLKAGQTVRGLDNFSTGKKRNLELLQQACGAHWKNFSFLEGDIRKPADCAKACQGVELVLHQAALGSVPRSLEDPQLTNACNIDGFLNMLVAARDAKVAGFVYASSSSVYGDEPTLPKREERIGNPLSPYALSKLVNEQYAAVFASCYGFKSIGLRYFNVFGQRQDPEGAYAAVIPKWFSALLGGRQIQIYGDGETSRDFCYIDNCVQANLLAAVAQNPEAWNKAYNVAVGERASLNQLFDLLRDEAARFRPETAKAQAQYQDFRAGDVRHSLADISQAQKLLGYAPAWTAKSGLRAAAEWYVKNM